MTDRMRPNQSLQKNLGSSRRTAMQMRLSDKGPIVAPPILRQPLQQLSNIVQSWPDIVGATHWNLWRRNDVDGVDFYRGENELGHIHLDGELHLALPHEVANHLIHGGLAKKFPYGSDWVMMSIVSDDDLLNAEWLMRLAYDLLGGEALADILARCRRRQGTAGRQAAGYGTKKMPSPLNHCLNRFAQVIE